MEKCILCGRVCNRVPVGPLNQQYLFDCHNCGHYLAVDLFVESEVNLSNPHLLAGYARERFESGEIVTFNHELVTDVLKSPYIPQSPMDKLDKLALWLFKKSKSFGQAIVIKDEPAICYAADKNELNSLLTAGVELKYISQENREDLAETEMKYSLTLIGHQYCQGLLEQARSSNIAFVAMWFDEEIKHAYVNAIAPAIEEAGYEAVRVDNIEHNNDITDEIIAGIKRSRFVIADLTGYRAGVYFEAGYARGFGLPVIYLCRNDWFEGEKDADDRIIKEKVHFDINHQNIIVWSNEAELKTRLLNRILATI